LDKNEIPTINENYLPTVALRAILTLAKSISSLLIGSYPSIATMEHPEIPKGSNSPFLNFTPKEEVKPELLNEAKEMIDICWKPILQAISFGWLHSTTEDLNHDIAEVYLNFIPLCQVLGLSGPRDAFVSSLSDQILPIIKDDQRVELTPALLTERNFEAFQVLFRVIQYLGNEFESTWFIILEALQMLDRVARISAIPTSPAPQRASVSVGSPIKAADYSFGTSVMQVRKMSQDDNVNFVANSVDRLFIEAGFLPDKSFKNFILAICQLLDESFETSAKQSASKSKLVGVVFFSFFLLSSLSPPLAN